MTDMEEIIKKEISLIGGLQERVAFKDMIEQLFLSLYETNQEMYRELESRVMDDLAFDINRYQIVTGIVEREYVDLSHHFLSPMFDKDVEERNFKASEILKQISETGEYSVGNYFMKYDYLDIEKLLSKKRIGGMVKTVHGNYPAEFVVRRNEKYLREIAHLYEVFICNGIPWQTVNAPYLYKFINVLLVSISDLPESEVILEIAPNFEEYAEYTYENYIPIWNIKKLNIESTVFPVPCEDHKGYEHTVSISKYGNAHTYLIDDSSHIYSMRQQGNQLVIMGEEVKKSKWKIYAIRRGQNRKFERFTYPIMTNQKKDEFMERFSRKCTQRVRTDGELARFISGYELEEYVEYAGVEVQDRIGKQGFPETYAMNSFIVDEIRERNFQKRLVIKFRSKGLQTFLVRDIMSFLVSEVQFLYGEYSCEGVLI